MRLAPLCTAAIVADEALRSEREASTVVVLIRAFASVFNRLGIRWQRRLLRVSVPRFFVGVVGVCVEDDKILLARHRFGDPRWRLPGGFLQRDETIAECLQRELREELGVEAAVDGILDITAGYRYPRVEVVLRAHLLGPMGRFSEEVIEARYFALHDLPPVRIDQRRLIERALEASA
jgi:ADP-ribose pyrophosphatase YjhB (NUDIX family)